MKRSIVADGVKIEFTLIQAVRRDVLIQALPGDIVRVYAPKTARLKDIDEVIRLKAKDIIAMREGLTARPLRDGDAVMIEGVKRNVAILNGKPKVDIKPDSVTIFAPDDDARSVLKNALSKMALVRIRENINKYLPITGGSYNRIAIRDQRTRWGSCSSKHNLNFNWKLIMAPPECLTYVVIHELCHLTEFNHSKRFWAMVESCQKDYEVWKNYLRNNGKTLNI